MSKNFIRKPANAVTSLDDIKIGTKLFHAYGIWQPFADDSEHVVTREPIKFRDHPDYSGVHSSQADSIVFDVNWRYSDRDHIMMHFAADGNLGEGYNNNYWFKNYIDAKVFVDQCREDWLNNPDQIAEEEERRKIDREMDALYENDYEYNS